MKHLLLMTAVAGLVGLGAAVVEVQTIGQVHARASGVVQAKAATAATAFEASGVSGAR